MMNKIVALTGLVGILFITGCASTSNNITNNVPAQQALIRAAAGTGTVYFLNQNPTDRPSQLNASGKNFGKKTKSIRLTPVDVN